MRRVGSRAYTVQRSSGRGAQSARKFIKKIIEQLNAGSEPINWERIIRPGPSVRTADRARWAGFL